jgi:hypothetical protein
MAFIFKRHSDTEFTIEGHRIFKDASENWTISPIPESTKLKAAIQKHINSLEQK